MLKKMASLLLVSILCIGLFGCSDSDKTKIQTGAVSSSASTDDNVSAGDTTNAPSTNATNDNYFNDVEMDWGQQDEVVQREGNEIGDVCYGYDLPIINGDGPSGETINPVTINPDKSDLVTVINFWGTWCAPCVNELPYFDQIAQEYDNVKVIAIHGGNINSNEAYSFIAENYADSPIIFAADYIPEGGVVENGYATTLGGGSFYPYTLILDNEGVITAVFDGVLTYEELKTAVDAAM